MLETTASASETLERLARTILRIKARIVHVDPALKTGAEKTVLSLKAYGKERLPFIIDSKEKTVLFDALLESQIAYQRESKADPAWIKGR